MTKKTTIQKEPVKLREKKLANGNVSLYLDIYRNGKRQKEYLKLYLIDATTPLEREQNRQTLATAQAIKSKRLIEMQNGEYSFTRQFKEDTPFLEYYRKMVEERHKNPESEGNWGNWRSCLRYLEIYCDEKTTFKDITPEFINGFKDFLNNVEKDTHKRTGPRRERDVFQGLSQNSKVSYFNKLRACINQAYDERIIPVNPLRGIEGFKAAEVKRDYLTLEEVKQLAATPCRYPILKRAFLFSCLTSHGAKFKNLEITRESSSNKRRLADKSILTFPHRQKNTSVKEATRKIPSLQDLHTELGLHWNYSVGAWLPISIKI